MSPCLRMHTCCCCLDTGKGTILISIASIAATILTFGFLLFGLICWDRFSLAVIDSYHRIGIVDDDTIEFILRIVWWGNIFTLILCVIYVILCILMIVGVNREQFKHMIPWISFTSMVLPFFTTCFIIQLIFGIIGGPELAVLVPAIIVLVWCGFWAYGFFCAVPHYRMLKGDIHRPVATIFKR